MAGIGAILLSTYLVRRAQIAQASVAPVPVSLAEKRNRHLVRFTFAFLALGVAALFYIAVSGLGATPLGSKAMLILLGALLALLGGLVSYYSSRKRLNSL